MDEKTRILKTISNLVCVVVNDNIDRIKGNINVKADYETMYECDKKPVDSVVFARSLCYYILHTMYGFSYSTISRITGRSKQGIISHVSRMAHNYLENDCVYSELFDIVKSKMGIK